MPANPQCQPGGQTHPAGHCHLQPPPPPPPSLFLPGSGLTPLQAWPMRQLIPAGQPLSRRWSMTMVPWEGHSAGTSAWHRTALGGGGHGMDPQKYMPQKAPPQNNTKLTHTQTRLCSPLCISAARIPTTEVFVGRRRRRTLVRGRGWTTTAMRRKVPESCTTWECAASPAAEVADGVQGQGTLELSGSCDMPRAAGGGETIFLLLFYMYFIIISAFI